MSNPAYLWLIDANGSPITGNSLVTGRRGAIELKAVRITYPSLWMEIPGD